MVDKRFVEGADVLSELESRPNLMDLTPLQFEQLVGNLFSMMGLDAKQTQSSRDGGVDDVAFDTRPLVGGKIVIQAKRYRHTVGVSAVRDPFGTMNHEGANKGILVTTSSYGPDAYDFIKNKPIDLIDGGGLLYWLEFHAGVKARIFSLTNSRRTQQALADRPRSRNCCLDDPPTNNSASFVEIVNGQREGRDGTLKHGEVNQRRSFPISRTIQPTPPF